MAVEVAAEHERRRQWAALRGEKLPPEVEAAAAAAAAAAAGPLARETWMTDLPPEMSKVVGAAAQEGNRTFSRCAALGGLLRRRLLCFFGGGAGIWEVDSRQNRIAGGDLHVRHPYPPRPQPTSLNAIQPVSN